jgi:hypothetical protein
MGHVVLLGDSIFDNARYVPDRPCVIEQVQRGLPRDWTATLLAVDGSVVEDIAAMLPRIPANATHLVLSVGGNDALTASGLLRESAATVGDALEMLAEVVGGFQDSYRAMLQLVLERKLPLCVCTIYDAIPSLEPASRMALAGFNDVITRSAIAFRIPLIDLRIVCGQAQDYSPLSSIEPSVVGGAKIADVICRMATGYDFTSGRTAVWI